MRRPQGDAHIRAPSLVPLHFLASSIGGPVWPREGFCGEPGRGTVDEGRCSCSKAADLEKQDCATTLLLSCVDAVRTLAGSSAAEQCWEARNSTLPDSLVRWTALHSAQGIRWPASMPQTLKSRTALLLLCCLALTLCERSLDREPRSSVGRRTTPR
jgi:hypothetical protein